MCVGMTPVSPQKIKVEQLEIFDSTFKMVTTCALPNVIKIGPRE